MYAVEDLKALNEFLRSTPEAGLKKMLIGGVFTENHLRILLKVARATSADEFATHAEAATYPKIKFSPSESPLKESFWKVACEACAKVGLLHAAKKAA